MHQWAGVTLTHMWWGVRWDGCLSLVRTALVRVCVCAGGDREDMYVLCVCRLTNSLLIFPVRAPQILYNQQSVEVQGSLKRRLITQLQPDTDYSFVLTSRGNIAGGLQQQVSIRTAPDLINAKPSTHQPQGSKMTINLPKVQTTTRVRSVHRDTRPDLTPPTDDCCL